MIVNVDPETAAFCVLALRAHRPVHRSNGFTVPSSIASLEEAFMSAARVLYATQGDSNRPKDLVLDEAASSIEDEFMPAVLLLTYRQAAHVLGVSPRTLERLVRTGELPKVKLGKAARIRQQDLDTFVDGLDQRSMQDRIVTKGAA